MNVTIKVKKVGGSYYLLVPPTLARKLELAKGNELIVLDTSNENIMLTKK